MLHAFATGSGEIDFEEFAELMVKQLKQGSEQEVRDAFKAYDTDNKGYFTKDELLKLLMAVSQQSKDIKISKDEIEEVVKFLERNGRIDFDSKCVHYVTLRYATLRCVNLFEILFLAAGGRRSSGSRGGSENREFLFSRERFKSYADGSYKICTMT